MFPGVVAQIKPAATGAALMDVLTPLLFLVFNLGDLLGRALPQRAPPPADAPVPLLLLPLARLPIALALLVAGVAPATANDPPSVPFPGPLPLPLAAPAAVQWRLPALLSDPQGLVPIALVLALGASNGWVGAAAIRVASAAVAPRDQDLVAGLTALAVTGGIFVGSVAADAMIAALKI